jgi:putative acetyltransferase
MLESQPINVAPCDPRSPDACALIDKLSAELAGLYHYAEDGKGHFNPEDVLVPKSVFLIGRLGERPVCCGALRPMEPGVVEVKRMFVVPDCRGQGFSKKILTELERHAKIMGYGTIRLETGDRQREAIGLYEKAGYRRIANFGIYVGIQQSICFEKTLSKD